MTDLVLERVGRLGGHLVAGLDEGFQVDAHGLQVLAQRRLDMVLEEVVHLCVDELVFLLFRVEEHAVLLDEGFEGLLPRGRLYLEWKMVEGVD